MSSSLAEKNKEWSPEKADYGEPANRRHQDGTHRMNRDDRRFVALYTAMSPRRNDVPDDVVKWLDRVPTPEKVGFVDKANPFYNEDTDMMAVPASRAHEVVTKIRELGYEVEHRDGIAQFKFTPRPTVGEIVIKGRDILAPVEE